MVSKELMMPTPIVVVRFTPKFGNDAQVEKVLRGMVPATRGEPGCRRYDLFRSSDAAGIPLFFLIENYANEASVQAHRETFHYKEYRANILPLLERPPEVQLLEIIDAKPY
jgi:quinol monooxygenase YgiN